MTFLVNVLLILLVVLNNNYYHSKRLKLFFQSILQHKIILSISGVKFDVAIWINKKINKNNKTKQYPNTLLLILVRIDVFHFCIL